MIQTKEYSTTHTTKLQFVNINELPKNIVVYHKDFYIDNILTKSLEGICLYENLNDSKYEEYKMIPKSILKDDVFFDYRFDIYEYFETQPFSIINNMKNWQDNYVLIKETEYNQFYFLNNKPLVMPICFLEDSYNDTPIISSKNFELKKVLEHILKKPNIYKIFNSNCSDVPNIYFNKYQTHIYFNKYQNIESIYKNNKNASLDYYLKLIVMMPQDLYMEYLTKTQTFRNNNKKCKTIAIELLNLNQFRKENLK